MRKLFIFFLLFSSLAFGQTQVIDKTADTSPTADDLIYTVNDPAGTPAGRKVTLGNVPKALLSGITNGYLLYNNNGVFGGVTGSSTSNGGISLTSQSITANPLIIIGASGQTGDFIKVQNSVGTDLAKINYLGSLYFGADVYSAMSSNQSTWYMQNAGDTKSFLQTNSSTGYTRLDSDHKIILAPNNTAYFDLGTSGHLTLGSGAAVSEFRLLEASANGSNYSGFKSPLSLAGNVVYELPGADGTNGYQLTTNGSGVLSWTAAGSGGGGLTKFTEAESTSSPNGTVYVDSLTAAGASTNVDAVIKPKGTGAFLTSIPDSTSVGGNKRGANAVDLQTSRSQAAMVASGTGSSQLGGIDNKASGNYSATLGGAGNESTGQGSVSSGSGAIASGDYSQAQGYSLTSSGYASRATGTGSKSQIYGQHSQASGNFSVQGDAQTSVLTARTTTSGATPTNVWLDGASTRITIPANTTWMAEITVVARANGGYSAWTAKTLINRDGSNNTTIPGSLSNAPSQVDFYGEGEFWSISVTADNTNEALNIGVTGSFGYTVKWVSRIELTEVSG